MEISTLVMMTGKMEQASANRAYDAIVIGSGMTGGVAAPELTEKGVQVLIEYMSGNMHPNGPANSSGVVGRYLMDHNEHNTNIGIFFDGIDRYFSGKQPNGCYIPSFPKSWRLR